VIYDGEGSNVYRKIVANSSIQSFNPLPSMLVIISSLIIFAAKIGASKAARGAVVIRGGRERNLSLADFRQNALLALSEWILRDR
jgi:hypothetical protein